MIKYWNGDMFIKLYILMVRFILEVTLVRMQELVFVSTWDSPTWAIEQMKADMSEFMKEKQKYTLTKEILYTRTNVPASEIRHVESKEIEKAQKEYSDACYNFKKND